MYTKCTTVHRLHLLISSQSARGRTKKIAQSAPVHGMVGCSLRLVLEEPDGPAFGIFNLLVF